MTIKSSRLREVATAFERGDFDNCTPRTLPTPAFVLGDNGYPHSYESLKELARVNGAYAVLVGFDAYETPEDAPSGYAFVKDVVFVRTEDDMDYWEDRMLGGCCTVRRIVTND